jgi:hypothetical protein
VSLRPTNNTVSKPVKPIPEEEEELLDMWWFFCVYKSIIRYFQGLWSVLVPVR